MTLLAFVPAERYLSAPGHKFNGFGTGTIDTLWNIPRAQARDPISEVASWWRSKYCTRRMCLVVSGISPELAERWVQRDFGNIPRDTPDGVEELIHEADVFDTQEMGISNERPDSEEDAKTES